MHRPVRLDAAHLGRLDDGEEVAVGLLSVGRRAEPAGLLQLALRLAQKALAAVVLERDRQVVQEQEVLVGVLQHSPRQRDSLRRVLPAGRAARHVTLERRLEYRLVARLELGDHLGGECGRARGPA